MELLGRLCESLARDETLREVLSEAGINREQWDLLDTAATTGTRTPQVDELLALIVTVGEECGVDLVGRVREYQPLPAGMAGVRSVQGCARTSGAAAAPTSPATRHRRAGSPAPRYALRKARR